MIRLYREAYSGLPREAWLISAAAFVNRAGTMVMAFLVVWLAEARGLPSGQAAMFLSLWGLGALVGVALGGRLTDRVGPVPVQVMSFVGAGAGFMALPGLFELPLVGATIFLIGLNGEAFRPANSALLAATCDEATVGRAFALHRLAINAGWAIGPVVGGIIAEHVGWDLVFRIDAATCALSALLIWIWFGRRGASMAIGRAAEDLQASSPWSDRVLVLMCLCTMGVATAFLQFVSTVPEYLRLHGWAKDHIGLVEAINPVLIAVFEMILVHRLSRPNPLRLMALGGALVAVGFFMLPVSTTFLWVAGFVVITTFGEMLDHPFASAWIAVRAPSGSRGRFMGLYALAFSVAFVVGPFGAGVIVDVADWSTLWFACAVLAGLSSIGFLWIGRQLDRESRAG